MAQKRRRILRQGEVAEDDDRDPEADGLGAQLGEAGTERACARLTRDVSCDLRAPSPPPLGPELNPLPPEGVLVEAYRVPVRFDEDEELLEQGAARQKCGGAVGNGRRQPDAEQVDPNPDSTSLVFPRAVLAENKRWARLEGRWYTRESPGDNGGAYVAVHASEPGERGLYSIPVSRGGERRGAEKLAQAFAKDHNKYRALARRGDLDQSERQVQINVSGGRWSRCRRGDGKFLVH
jgi:hypothetical protein